MTVETLRHFLGWCGLINYAILLLWFFLYLGTYSLLKGLVQRWFKIPDEKYDSLNYKGMMYFKLAVWLFNITPYLALRIMA